MLVEFGIVRDKGRYCVDGLKEEEDENLYFSTYGKRKKL